jgi:hypothetical protein
MNCGKLSFERNFALRFYSIYLIEFRPCFWCDGGDVWKLIKAWSGKSVQWRLFNELWMKLWVRHADIHASNSVVNSIWTQSTILTSLKTSSTPIHDKSASSHSWNFHDNCFRTAISIFTLISFYIEFSAAWLHFNNNFRPATNLFHPLFSPRHDESDNFPDHKIFPFTFFG